MGTSDAFKTDLSLAGVFTATDTDGDKVIIDAGAVVTIENDIPANNGTTLTIGAVQEDALNTVGVAVGNSEGGQTTTATLHASDIATLVSPGADSPVTIGLNTLLSVQLFEVSQHLDASSKVDVFRFISDQKASLEKATV